VGRSRHTVAAGLDTSAFLTHFSIKANDVFGEDDYLVEAIVHDPSFSCELGSGQSHGTNLASLASGGDVFPICESYAPALARVRGFAQALLETEYAFELTDRETIEAIVVTDLRGNERELLEGDYSYDRDGGGLSLNPEALTPSDRSLRVEIQIHCQPVAR
jgi:hypothetical protein